MKNAFLIHTRQSFRKSFSAYFNSFVSIFGLLGIMLIATIILFVQPVTAQPIEDGFAFGRWSNGVDKAMLAFKTTDPTTYTVSFTPKGFIFDPATSHNDNISLPNVTAGNFSNGSSLGYYKTGTHGGKGGDIGLSGGMIGCGLYEISITAPGADPFTTTIDLTDYKWISQSDTAEHAILFEVTGTNPIQASAWVEVKKPGKTPIDSVINCFDPVQVPLTYWDMVRVDNIHVPYKSYARNRNGFILSGAAPLYPGFLGELTIDYHVNVLDNFTIPAGNTLLVLSDTDGINQQEPMGNDTQLRFATGKTCDVYGTLRAEPNLTSITSWFGINSGTWEGIILESGVDGLYMYKSEIRHAHYGVNMTDCSWNQADLEWSCIDSCTSGGMNIRNSNPYMYECSIYNNNIVGAYIHNMTPGNNSIYPYFSRSTIHSTINTGRGDGIFGEHGAYMVLDSCYLNNNQANGLHLSDGARAKLNGCNIFENTLNGICLDSIGTDGWTTVQNSFIWNNSKCGLKLSGKSKIRGWFADPEPDSAWKATDVIGNNCIFQNWVNIFGADTSRFDPASLYIDPYLLPHYLGTNNELKDPDSVQVILSGNSYAGLMKDYWTPKKSHIITPPATMDSVPDRGSTGNCIMMSRTANVAPPTKEIQDICDKLHILYNPAEPIVMQIRNSRRPKEDQITLDVVRDNATLNGGTWLLSAYPNPFNATCNIRFSNTARSYATIAVYDALGRLVKIQAEGMYDAGIHEAVFDGSNLPSGIYTYVLRTGSIILASRILLAK